MKINMPVTDREVVMQEGQTIVSKTNLKGAITYVNRDFIEISGFSEAELIGKNHNIVRHPDMPPEAFADLWNTMKQGKPWTGFVKNRCKNGDYYWVRADVAPVYENGDLVEYISVRSKPTQEQIDAASNFYLTLKGKPELLNEGVPVTAFGRFKRETLGKIKIGHQFGFIAAVVMFLSLIIVFNMVEKNDAIAKLESEIAGMSLIQEARSLIEHVPKHRGLSQALLSGDRSVSPLLSEEKRQISESFARLDGLIGQHKEILGPQDSVALIKREWEQLAEKNSSLSSVQSFSQHSKVIEDVQSWMMSLSIQSRLSSDESVDLNLLVPLISRQLPLLTDTIGQARGLGTGVLASGEITSQKQARFINLNAQISAALKEMDRTLENLYRNMPELESYLDSHSQAASQSGSKFLSSVGELSEGKVDFVSSSDYFAAGTNAIQKSFKLFDLSSDYVMSRLDEKINRASWVNYSTAAVSLTFIALLAGALFYTSRSILSGMRQATQSAQRICQGDYRSDYHIDSDNEIGRMLFALKSMQIAQGFAVENFKRIAEESLRIKHALDACSTNVMLADVDMNIIYMNTSAAKMFSDAQEDIRQEIVDFDASSLVGANADIFHKNPAHQRSMVEALKEPLVTEIQLGGHIFKLIATPVFNDHGQRIGIAVEWDDRTEELARLEVEKRLATENARIKQALDNVSANVMVADANRDIIYMNPAVIETLKAAESDIQKDLPQFAVAKLLGGTIDQFHKDPSHQINMLNALSSTHSTKIVVGGRHMALTVNPVKDENGVRLGTAVEWEDQTAEVLIQQELDALVAAANAGDLDKRIGIEGKEGFFRNLSEGLNALLDVTSQFVDDVGEVFGSMADGDLTKSIHRDYRGKFNDIKSNANDSMTKLSEVLSRIRLASNAVRVAANEVSQGSDDLSRRTEAQASSLEETAASMEEINVTVKQSSENAGESNTLAEQARSKAELGSEVVQKAVAAMNEILASSTKINDIIGVIDEIAFQTNLLALNAAVEAARAGEQGRGFAVVAGEVRSLSQRSASAAKEIKDLIRDSVSKAESGSQLVNQSGETLNEIMTAVDLVASKIQDVANAAIEQTSGIAQINEAVSQMDSMTQQNAALVEETTAASRSMAEEAQGMDKMISFFKMNG